MKFSTKRFAILLILCIIVTTSSVLIAAFIKRSENSKYYNQALNYINTEDYDSAYKIFNNLNEYKNSKTLMKKAEIGKNYLKAKELLSEKKYSKAIAIFEQILDFKNSAELLKQSKYQLALQFFDNEEYDKAKQIFDELDDYKDSLWYLDKIDLNNIKKLRRNIYAKAYQLLKDKQYSKALEKFNSILEYKDSKKKAKICKRNILSEKQRLKLSHTIATGIEYVLAVTENNEVRSVGEDSYGECNDVKSWKNIISVDCYGEVSVGLHYNGTVEVAGNLTQKQKEKIANWKNIIDIAVGEKYVVALKKNGRVVAEGHNGDKQCNVNKWKNIKDIDAGWRITVGLTKNGKLKFNGMVSDKLRNDYNATKDEWKNVVKISVSGGDPNHHRGSGHIVGLKSDGTIIAIGDNLEKQCEVHGKRWKNIIDIAAGDWYTVGLKKNGRILITGENNPAGLQHTKYIEQEKIENWKKIHIQDISAGYGMTVIQKSNGLLDIMGFTDGQNKGDNALLEVLNWTDIRQKKSK